MTQGSSGDQGPLGGGMPPNREREAIRREIYAALADLIQGRMGPEGLGKPMGLGDPAGPFSCGDDPQVWRLIQAGSPRLALARALGTPLVPLGINLRGTFATTTAAQVVANVGQTGSQGGTPYRIVQDTLVDAIRVRLQNESTSANQNQFQSMQDFFYNFQGNIECQLSVEGQPRYMVTPSYTPLSNLCDMLNGNSHWPYGWILKPNQQLLANFLNDTVLPFAPYEVILTFCCWTTVSDGDVPSNKAAYASLKQLGYCVPDALVTNICRG